MTVKAIYEDGVFKPKERVDLEDKTEVQLEIKPARGARSSTRETSSGSSRMLRKASPSLETTTSTSTRDDLRRYRLYDESMARIHWATPEEEYEAFEYLKRYDDKEYSSIDCLSFVIMEKHDIKEALTVDRDFTHRFIARPGPR